MSATFVLAASVVLLSVDGLKPDYVLEADAHGLAIPNLRRLVEDGAYARGVRGVYPTVTYPSHATMVTGVAPSRHRIYSNRPFDPFSKNDDGWYWYAEDLGATTLWERAEEASLVTASVDWPTSVGATVSHNIVQYWRAGNAEDRKLIRALSTPGLLGEAEAAVGPYPDGYDYGVEADRRRTAFIEYVLSEKKPDFLTAYFAGLDTEEHESGPYSRGTFEVLEILDELVGRIRSRAGVLALVSDHGFLPSEKDVNLNAALAEAGLVDVDARGGGVSDWRAFSWGQGGSAMIVLRDATDETSRGLARAVLSRLAADASNGIDAVLEGDAAVRLGGYPDAAFIVGLKKGFRTGSRLSGPVVEAGRLEGTHGYLPSSEAMDSALFLVGEGIPRGRDLGRIDMRDIAPTLAALLGLSLPEADGRNLLENRHAEKHP
jgi:predicted AlkP superfamily pyrophosphatase or phosphodiesterase